MGKSVLIAVIAVLGLSACGGSAPASPEVQATVDAASILTATVEAAPTEAPDATAAPQRPTSGLMTVPEIFAEFERNSIAAVNKYTGQTVKVKGEIQAISYSYATDSSGNLVNAPKVSIAEGSSWWMNCYFADVSQVEHLTTGSEVTVSGTFANWTRIAIELYHCSID
jgi:hypothetical protein